MTLHWWWVLYIDQVVLVEILNSKIAIASACEICPLQFRSYLRGWCIQINPLFRLCIEERVAQKQLLTLQVTILWCHLVPANGHGAKVTYTKSLLVLT